MTDNTKLQTSIDDLALMVAKGFEHVEGRMDKFEGRMDKLEGRMDKFEGRMDKFEGRMGNIEHQMEALNSNVNNYLELSEKRYSELKQRDALLAKWLKLIAEKTGVPIDVSQLEKI